MSLLRPGVMKQCNANQNLHKEILPLLSMLAVYKQMFVISILGHVLLMSGFVFFRC